MKHSFQIILLLALLYSCSQPNSKVQEYPEHVGDIAFNPNLDDPDFKPCNESRIYQYYNFGKGIQYKGEKKAIVDYFTAFSNKEYKGDTGFLTIRFVVNCEGKTGRFRTEGMNEQYQLKEFDDGLVQELLLLTKRMDGWVIVTDGKPSDYYQYLTFKIENGKLIEITP